MGKAQTAHSQVVVKAGGREWSFTMNDGVERGRGFWCQGILSVERSLHRLFLCLRQAGTQV